MNWLAHFLLAEPDPAFQVGSILPDLLRPGALAHLSQEYRRGIDHHHLIDAFTDSHPIVRRSLLNFPAPFRRFRGVITDVFYDHFLARDWDSFSPVPLSEFADRVYSSFEICRAHVPLDAHICFERMRTQDWLCSYQEVSGIALALSRIGARLRRPVDLGASVSVLEQHYHLFRRDFRAFFPELVSRVSASYNVFAVTLPGQPFN